MSEETSLLLDAISGRKPNPLGILRANCPFCEIVVHKTDRKYCLSLNVDSGFWKCYRCESKGRLGEDELPFDTSTIQRRPKTEAPAVVMPEGFVPLWTDEGKATLLLPARQYLRSGRHAPITPEIIKAAQIGAVYKKFITDPETGKPRRNPDHERVVVPIHKPDGKLVGYVGRLWWKKPPKGSLTYRYSKGFDRGGTMYNEKALYVETDEPCFAVEGVFDTFPFWPNAVAMLGKTSPQQKAMLLEAKRPVFIVFDGDAHREATALAMMLRMRGKRAAALKLPPGVDPDECADHVRAKAAATFAARKEEGHAATG